MLNIYAGRALLMMPALIRVLRERDADLEALVVVPRQLTLETERQLLDALKMDGAFTLQVLGTQRFCGRLFEAAGLPDGVRVDDRGRAMLVRASVRAVDRQLQLYRGKYAARGFAERCAEQIETFRQAGVTCEALRACAQTATGADRLKLMDLATIQEAYEARLAGRYQDGEEELNAAAGRAPRARFLKRTLVCFFGYDAMPPTLLNLIAAVAAAGREVAVFLPADTDPALPDADCFVPMRDQAARLMRSAEAAGARAQVISVREEGSTGLIVHGPERHEDLRHLEKALFAPDKAPSPRPARAVQLASFIGPMEECRFAAALARSLVARCGWHWADIRVLAGDIAAYTAPLRSAFREYGVPLCLSEDRKAARHPVCECLLTALKTVEKGYQPDDLCALLGTGYLPVDEDEAERFSNYLIRTGLRASRFEKPLMRGTPEEIERLEDVRARAIAPLAHLRSALRAATDLEGQLRALIAFLEDIDACQTGQRRIDRLVAQGDRSAANEEAQVWNRIPETLDQMYALMGPEKLPMGELRGLLEEALSAIAIKALPQSGDAVLAQGAQTLATRPAKAVLVVGLTDQLRRDTTGLLTDAQRSRLQSATRRHLGLDGADLSRMKRFIFKSNLGMALSYVAVSYPTSALDGSPQRESPVIDFIRACFASAPVRGGLSEDPAIVRMLWSAPRAATARAAQALSEASRERERAYIPTLLRLSDADPAVSDAALMMRSALRRGTDEAPLDPRAVRGLYGALERVSASRLASFAECPMRHFLAYGLRPERIRPYEITPADEGTFYHAALYEFLRASRSDLSRLTDEEAEARMDAVCASALEVWQRDTPLGDSATSRAQARDLVRVLRSAARMLAGHMRGSLFHTEQLEAHFGAEDGPDAIRLEGGTVLEGKIDRVDAWNGALRIIDYKRGSRPFSLDRAYYGLQIQLPLYWAASHRRTGGACAGLYHFPIRDDIVPIQSSDAQTVRQERLKQERLLGLMPDDLNLIRAQTPEFERVLGLKLKQDGTPYQTATLATPGDFDRLISCALDRAQWHVTHILEGECAASPVKMNRDLACKFCDHRASCGFDAELDDHRIRTYDSLSARTVLELLRQEYPEADADGPLEEDEWEN